MFTSFLEDTYITAIIDGLVQDFTVYFVPSSVSAYSKIPFTSGWFCKVCPFPKSVFLENLNTFSFKKLT